MIITFLGHHSLNNYTALSEKIEQTIVENIPPNCHIQFYCGGYGEFDRLCTQICRSIREKILTAK